MLLCASLLTAVPARALGTATVGGRRYASLRSEVSAISPLAGGHLLVRGRSFCFFASLAEVLRPSTAVGADFVGDQCDSAATDGDTSVALAMPGRVKVLEFAPGETSSQRVGRMRPLYPERDDQPSVGPPKPPLSATVTRFAPDGRSLVFGERSGRVLVAPYSGGKEPREFAALPAAVVDLRFVAGGQALLALDATGIVRAWDWASERPLPGPAAAKRPVRAIAAAARAPAFARWREGLGAEVFSTDGWKKTGAVLLPDRPLRVFELSPDGRRLAVSEGGVAAVYDAATGARLGFVAHGLGRVTALSFLSDGLLVAGGADGRLVALRVPDELAKSVSAAELAAADAPPADGAAAPAAVPAGAMPARPGIAPPIKTASRVEPEAPASPRPEVAP